MRGRDLPEMIERARVEYIRTRGEAPTHILVPAGWALEVLRELRNSASALERFYRPAITREGGPLRWCGMLLIVTDGSYDVEVCRLEDYEELRP